MGFPPRIVKVFTVRRASRLKMSPVTGQIFSTDRLLRGDEFVVR